jgi:formate hydrogenlyase subunit 7
VLPVEVYVPGCPPSPVSLLYGLWLALGKVDQRLARGEIPADALRGPPR